MTAFDPLFDLVPGTAGKCHLSLVDVLINDGRGTLLHHLDGWHDEDHAIVRSHGVGGCANNESRIVPISDLRRI